MEGYWEDESSCIVFPLAEREIALYFQHSSTVIYIYSTFKNNVVSTQVAMNHLLSKHASLLNDVATFAHNFSKMQ
jgi:hypothetical protein